MFPVTRVIGKERSDTVYLGANPEYIYKFDDQGLAIK